MRSSYALMLHPLIKDSTKRDKEMRYACVCVYIYIYIYTYIYTNTYKTSVCLYVCVYIYTRIYKASVCLPVCVRACVCVYTHTRAHTHTVAKISTVNRGHTMSFCWNLIFALRELKTLSNNISIVHLRPPLWSSGQSFWLQIQRSRVRFPALPDFLSSSGSETGSTQPREENWGATWMKKVAAPGLENRD